MLESGSVTGLPGKYRITLAMSIAFLLHTLVMSVLSFTPPETENHRQTMRVELVSAGSEPSPKTVTSTATQNQEEFPHLAAAERTGSQPNDQPSDQSSQSRTSTASVAGSPVATVQTDPEPVTQISRSPQDTDPYLASLAARVGDELNKRPVPSSHRVAKPVNMELELKLMGSGALTNAKVTRSTGFQEIDKAVYQAALFASPYPEPPEEYSGSARFRVELIFTPERL
ncbi:energy transducer TonB [Marinobacter sp. ATCH36]|uniref:energy transducer TonB family protein n=1 Tax=Marinobacter sp. ATCH36 TaxID=2945106 RepID=UPI002021B1A5|nr:energy transducer TonB [Marinobacter sp. ATCH36]MCL7944324.1 energy transducer TonB [Marinobacter sp. ATCH36]